MKNKKEVQFMSAVAKDIINLKFKPSMTLLQIEKQFFKVMRKHGIKNGTKTKSGLTVSNFEWTLCLNLYVSQLPFYFLADRMFDIPKDLQYY